MSHGQVNARTLNQAQEEARTPEVNGSQGWGSPEPADSVIWQGT